MANSKVINIHVKVGKTLENMADEYNTGMRNIDKTLRINFKTNHQPHITLYMTDFKDDKIPDMIQKIKQTVSTMKKGKISQANGYREGTYVMWNTSIEKYIKQLSNTIVDSTYQFAKPNQPVPGWIKDLPDPEQRRRKTEYVQKYGSPNVYEEFEPHISLGCDTDKEALEKGFQGIHVQEAEFESFAIALGTAGECGTVMRGLDMGYFYLK